MGMGGGGAAQSAAIAEIARHRRHRKQNLTTEARRHGEKRGERLTTEEHGITVIGKRLGNAEVHANLGYLGMTWDEQGGGWSKIW